MHKSGLRLLVAFLVLVVVQATATQLFLNWSLRRVELTDLGAFNRAMQGRVNADIIISGSSRAYRHYDPRIISKHTGLTCFNLSRNASQIDVQLGVLKTYLQHNRKPLVVVQNLDLQSLVLTKTDEIYDSSHYVPYLSDPNIASFLQPIDAQLWKWKWLPLYAYSVKDTSFTWMTGLRVLCGAAPKEFCYEGFAPMEKLWTKEFKRFQDTHPTGIEISIDAGGIAALKELTDLCRKEGIRLIFVYSPQYHEMVGLTINRSNIFSIFSSIAVENQIPFLDYTDSPLSREQNYFYNAQHLNAHGATLFSEDFAQRLVELKVTAQGVK